MRSHQKQECKTYLPTILLFGHEDAQTNNTSQRANVLDDFQFRAGYFIASINAANNDCTEEAAASTREFTLDPPLVSFMVKLKIKRYHFLFTHNVQTPSMDYCF